MHSIEELEIAGYRAQGLANRFFRQDKPADHLSLVFPGIRYRCDGPLLYYPTSILLSLGADVLWADYAYDRQPDYRKLESRSQREWLFSDSLAALRAGLKQRAYRRTTMIGKSLGTLAIGHLLSTDPPPSPRVVWLTPLLTDPELKGQLEKLSNPSLFVIGSADDYYDGSLLDRLREKPSSNVVVLDGADHMLEVGGNMGRSLDNLRLVVESIQQFVQS